MLTFIETRLFTQLVYDYFRVIYYLRPRQGQVWMLTIYAKNEAASIPGPVLKRIKEELDGQN